MTDARSIRPMSWAAFKESGFGWLANRTLQLFGVSICFRVEADGTVTDAYPARVPFRGVDQATEADGYRKVSRYARVNALEIEHEAHENLRERLSTQSIAKDDVVSVVNRVVELLALEYAEPLGMKPGDLMADMSAAADDGLKADLSMLRN